MKKGRRTIGVLLTAMLIMASLSMSVFAEEGEQVSFSSDDGAYTAQKVSHPDRGAGEADGILDAEGTVGDRNQNYSWSCAASGEYLYIGTNFSIVYSAFLPNVDRSNLADISTWKPGLDKIIAACGVMWNGNMNMPQIMSDDAPFMQLIGNYLRVRSNIICINTTTGEAVPVEGVDGATTGFRVAVEKDNKVYFVSCKNPPTVYVIDPSADPYTATVAYESGTVNTAADVSNGIRALGVYHDKMVISRNTGAGAEILVAEHPDEGDYRVIATQEDLFGYPVYHYADQVYGGAVFEFEVYNDDIYMTIVTGTQDNRQGFALVKMHEENDSWTITPVIGDTADGAAYPFGLDTPTAAAATIMPYNGYLYIGGYNDAMTSLTSAFDMDFVHLYEDLCGAVCMWRLRPDGVIEKVCGEPSEMFPVVLSNIQENGYGSPTNQYTWRWQEYQGKLYMSTFDNSSFLYPVLQFINGDVLSVNRDELESEIAYIKVLLSVLKNAGMSESGAEAASATDSDCELTSADMQDILADAQQILASAHITWDAGAEAEDETPEEEIDWDEIGELEVDMETMLDWYMTIRDLLLQTAQAGSEELLNMVNQIHENKEELIARLPENLQNRARCFIEEELTGEKLYNFYCMVQVCRILANPKVERGFDLLVTSDGVNWDTITTDGFHDPYNYGIRVFGVTSNGLYAGTANPFYGTQVWKITDHNAVPEEPEPEESKPEESKPEESKPEVTDPSLEDGEGAETGESFSGIYAFVLILAAGGICAILLNRVRKREE